MNEAFWKLTADVTVNERIPLKLYQSQRSALRVAIADITGPMVHGRLSFVTATDTNDGLPHTLEHLVFMGSKTYPYKGFLDVVANRCLASGTNAWTDQDHTCYALSTVGSKGFLKVLPVYMDHLLSPTLTQSQYMTEVHHTDGEGNDAGVVYCEMQDYESEMWCLTNKKLKNLIYGDKSPYSVDTGGSLPDIRTLCSNERVMDYHRQNYHLKNLFITVFGKVNHNDLLASIEPVEERSLATIPSEFVRPFANHKIAAISKPRVVQIVCPADDESVGMVEMAWLAHSPNDVYTKTALFVLFDYLTETAVAPLKQDFIQTEDPFCSSVQLWLTEQTTCEISLTFSDVPVSKLAEIKKRFFEKTFVDLSTPAAFDMERMGFIIDQQIKHIKSKVENEAAEQISEALIGYQIYGPDNDPEFKELSARLNEIGTLRQLKNESAEYWQKLFSNTFSEKQYACVEAKPSQDAVDDLAKKEEKRIEEQRKLLGELGLKKCAQKIESAIAENTANQPTEDVLGDLIVRDFEEISMIPVKTISSLDPIKDFPKELKRLPVTTVLHDVSSEFIDATILIDTSEVGADDRRFLMLWVELMFHSPALVDGKLLPYEEVAKLSTKDLVSNSVGVGISGFYDRYYDRYISFKLRVDAPNQANLAKWAQIYLKDIQFDAKRVSMCAKKLVKYAADFKRDGSSMAYFLSTNSTFNPDSNNCIYSTLALEKFHQKVADEAESADPSAVLTRLEKLRGLILSAPLQIHFACDSTKINSEMSKKYSWNFLSKNKANPFRFCLNFLCGDKTTDNSTNLFKCLPEDGTTWENAGKSFAISVGGTESAFLFQKAPFEGDWRHRNTISAMLLSQYLSQSGGPLWCAIRGRGLAYGADLYVVPDRKTIVLNLDRCSQLSHAYKESKAVVMDLLDGKSLDLTQFEAAKRTLVCDMISSQASATATAQAALLGTIQNIDQAFIKEFCRQVWDANPDEVLKRGGPALCRLFTETEAVRSIAAHPSRLEEIKANFPGTEVVQLENIQIQPPEKF